MLAYLLAFELLGDRAPLRQRLGALLPSGAVAGAYLVARYALGYGTAGSGLYVGPGEPLRYLGFVATRVPVLASDLLFGLPAAFWEAGPPWRSFVITHQLFTPEQFMRLPSWHAAHLVLGVISLLAGLQALRWLASQPDAAPEAAAARWLACGSLLSLLASAGTAPSERLLVAPALGASVLLALLLAHGWKALADAAAPWSTRLRRPRALLALAIIAVHLALAGQHAYAQTAELRERAEASRRWALDADIPKHPEAFDIVIVSASDFATAANLPWVRLIHGLGLPRSYRRLSGALQAHFLIGIDDHSLELQVAASDLRDAFAGSIYRPEREVFFPGQRLRVPGMQIEILGVEASGNPWRMRIRFDRALDDPHLIFLHARPDGMRRFQPPRPGQRLLLPRAALPWGTS